MNTKNEKQSSTNKYKKHKKNPLGKGNKLNIDDMYISMITSGPLAGRPAFFIVLGNNKSRSVKLKKILSTIISKNNAHLCVLTCTKNTDTMLQNIAPLVTGIIRSGMYMMIETDGVTDNEEVPWLKDSTFVVVKPKTKKLSEAMAKRAFSFLYSISTANKSSNDGLPSGIYRPNTDDYKRIMIEPEWNDNKKIFKENVQAAYDTCLMFGYYFTAPINRILGIK